MHGIEETNQQLMRTFDGFHMRDIDNVCFPLTRHEAVQAWGEPAVIHLEQRYAAYRLRSQAE